MTSHERGRLHRLAVTFTSAVALLLGAAVALLWAWNTIAVDLLGGQRAQFRHALAAEMVLIAVFATWAFIARVAGARPAAKARTVGQGQE